MQQLEDMLAAGVAPTPTAAGLSPESSRLAELQQRLAEQGAVVSGLQGENASLRAELERQRVQAAELEGVLMVRLRECVGACASLCGGSFVRVWWCVPCVLGSKG